MELLRDRVLERARLLGPLSDFVRIWKLLYWSPSTLVPRPWTTGVLAELASSASRTVDSEVGCGVLNVTCVPPLKSMPRFRPLTASAPIEITTIAPEIANQR